MRIMYLIGGGNARVGDGLLVYKDLFRWNLNVPRMCCFRDITGQVIKE